ncbi:phage tail protein [Novosphingobium rosa]|uniref:phage tail protein n=1 Tax=Novosphingobium rosa TaxID=76978 RepID=UPI00082CF010|nr:phage tail protein [Novosphingobium rosa]
MQKAQTLRAAIEAALPGLTKDPERFWMVATKGNINKTTSASPNFQWSYTLELDFRETTCHPSLIFYAINQWAGRNQPELLGYDRPGYPFEAEDLDSEKVDLHIELPLTEKVVVTTTDGGALALQHLDEADLSFLAGGPVLGMLKDVWATTGKGAAKITDHVWPKQP